MAGFRRATFINSNGTANHTGMLTKYIFKINNIFDAAI